MKRYLAQSPVTLHGGIVELTNEQASCRAHALVSLGEGLYEICQTVQFKTGEVIGYDGEVNKSLLQQVEETAAEVGTLPAAAMRAREAAKSKSKGKGKK